MRKYRLAMLHHLRSRTPFVFGLLVLIVGVVAGEYWHIYDLIPHFDKLLHVLGGLAVAWMAFAVLQDDLVRLRWYKQALVIVAVACLVGMLWEGAEYVSNFTQHTHPGWYHYFHGGDLADTLGDLVADIAGAGLFALWALWKETARN